VPFLRVVIVITGGTDTAAVLINLATANTPRFFIFVHVACSGAVRLQASRIQGLFLVEPANLVDRNKEILLGGAACRVLAWWQRFDERACLDGMVRDFWQDSRCDSLVDFGLEAVDGRAGRTVGLWRTGLGALGGEGLRRNWRGCSLLSGQCDRRRMGQVDFMYVFIGCVEGDFLGGLVQDVV